MHHRRTTSPRAPREVLQILAVHPELQVFNRKLIRGLRLAGANPTKRAGVFRAVVEGHRDLVAAEPQQVSDLLSLFEEAAFDRIEVKRQLKDSFQYDPGVKLISCLLLSEGRRNSKIPLQLLTWASEYLELSQRFEAKLSRKRA